MPVILKDLQALHDVIKVFKSNISKDSLERRRNVDETQKKITELDSCEARLNKLKVDIHKSQETLELVTKKSATTISNQLHQCKQSNKFLNEFGREVEQLLNVVTITQARDDENALKCLREVNQKIVINSFCNGVRNHELRTLIKARNCVTLSEAITVAIDEEKNKPCSSSVFFM
ncbi:hypothetical protein MML48_7g00012308 [Holotrichia oblita]|uniref:Uncharacterized protein n=1 Tax=Holotrichia oblita TaxID=644536 RepID=A0ACB9SUW6_HOLOL|nr:hypothetical protein MML48_7g00012308 [Holotrichia oblita]